MLLTLLFALIGAAHSDQNIDVFTPIITRPGTQPGSPQAVADLAIRLLKEKAKHFSFDVDPSLLTPDHRDVFRIKKKNELIEIVGSTGVAAAWGLNHYLKQYCHSHVSWDGDQLNIPPIKSLPDVEETVTAVDWLRYYQNVCTTSYSFVWWNWTRWEREIDWMALNGFNLVLAFNGMEAAWEEVYLDMNLTLAEIQDHFTGPAFLAWNRMGNMRGYGGPLTKNWHDDQVVLQRRILGRMRSLGIIPVLPAFAGHVPRAITRIYPNASVSKTPVWNGFPDRYSSPYLLEPNDPLFKTIGSNFLRTLIALYGTDHFYNCDTFNENNPDTTDPQKLKQYGKAIYESITDVDPLAVWIMQGWLFLNGASYWTKERSKALLTSIPIGKMLVLDLQSELTPQFQRLDNYFGQPFIWCMLNNFGGTLGFRGAIESLNQNSFKARVPNMVGTGITPEGINTNYIMYDFMSELGWRNTSVNISEWTRNYTIRRYGEINEKAALAWSILVKSVYNYTGNTSDHGRYIFVNQPSLTLHTKYWFNTSEVFSALEHLLNASTSLKTLQETFIVDLIDVARQSLQHVLEITYTRAVNAYYDLNNKELKNQTERFISILEDLDELLGSHRKFLLGVWLEDAKAAGVTSLEKRIYERNARNQITLWGPDGQILDYANKQWSGLVRDYYLPRWKLFFEHMLSMKVNMNKFRQQVFKTVEQPFTFARSNYSVVGQGDPVELSKMVYTKWVKEVQQMG